jgi:hypothetical protein
MITATVSYGDWSSLDGTLDSLVTVISLLQRQLSAASVSVVTRLLEGHVMPVAGQDGGRI